MESREGGRVMQRTPRKSPCSPEAPSWLLSVFRSPRNLAGPSLSLAEAGAVSFLAESTSEHHVDASPDKDGPFEKGELRMRVSSPLRGWGEW